jgi:hypothetical protein
MGQQARPLDGAEGYSLYLRTNGQVQLDEINEYLRGLGLREVRPRMLQHYQKLAKHGYRSYLTQNRLDLSLAGESAWSEDLRAQYSEVRQAFDGEILHGNRTYQVSVESLGVLSATCVGMKVPTAGATVVLRLSATGIERLAIVTRSDKSAGRVHLAFDVFTSVPIASADAPYGIVLTFELPAEASSIAAFSDVLVRLDFAIAKLTGGDEEMPRVTRVSMASPLQVELTGNAKLDFFINLSGAVLTLRGLYWRSQREKLKTRGVELDNQQKIAAIQRDADAQLKRDLEAAVSDDTRKVLDVLRESDLELLEGAIAMLTLPIQMAASLVRSPRHDPAGNPRR